MFECRYLDSVVWELTLRCNARCVHCGSSAGKDRSDNLSDDEILRICDELAEVKCCKVALIGGEVFLHPLWRVIVQKLRAHNIAVQIITNGLSLNAEKIQFLHEQNIDTLAISLDGASPEIHDAIRGVPGTFSHILSLKDNILENLLPTIAITTITKKNILDLPNLMQLLLSSYFCSWQIQIGNPFGRLKEEMALSELEYYITGLFIALMQRRYSGKYVVIGMHDFGYYSQVIPNSVNVYNANWHGCPAGQYVMGIRSNGKVVGCLSIYDDNFIEGDLREHSIKEIWENKKFCDWNRKYVKYKNLTGVCKNCDYAFACCAGCCSSAVSQTGDANSVKLCFHNIENKYRNYQKEDSYGKLLKELVNGKINDEGYFVFQNGEILNHSSNFSVDDLYLQSLLDILK